MCAQAMTWGMGYEQFWHCSWREYFTYLRTKQISLEENLRNWDYKSWNQGRYFTDSLLSVYQLFNGMIDSKKAKKYPYPQKPYWEQSEKTSKNLKSKKKKEDSALLIQEHNLMIRALMQNKRASGAPSE